MKTNPKIVEAAKNLIANCLGTKSDEKLLIVTDDQKMEIGYAFAKAGRELGLDTVLVESQAQAKGEPPEIVAKAMADADVEFLLTTMSYSHTAARGKANENGARVASMPIMTEEIAEKYLDTDYKYIKEISVKLADIMKGSDNVRVETDMGTDISFSITGRECYADTGELTEKGCIGNLPAGEAYVAPLENTGTGTLVIDGVIAYLGQVKDPVTLKVKDGRIIDILGGESAEDLKEFLKDKDDEAWGIAEFGIGTNPEAELIGNPLVDEKVWGTIHIAFGTNKFMGGERASNTHYDCIIRKPTVYLDGKMILDKGKHVY